MIALNAASISPAPARDGARRASAALAGHRLRSHGGAAEQTVPFLLSHPLTQDYRALAESQRLRNFAIFEFALNGTAR